MSFNSCDRVSNTAGVASAYVTRVRLLRYRVKGTVVVGGLQ